MIRAKLGDRVIVHFKNSLPEATTIHWHGLRVPNEMDGAPGVTQPPIESGGEFRYEFELRDAGTYWYHPHTDSSTQVGRGLYGAFIVEDPADPKAFGDDLVMLLSDMGLDERGELLPADSGGNFGDLFGREGAVLLVNGKVRPTLKVRNGKQQRWRIINATRARYYNVRLRNHRFMRLGGDNGLAARSADVYNLIITPGERADAVFTPADPPGSTNVLRWVPTERGYGSTFSRPSETMLLLETVADAPVTPEPIPTELRTIEPLDLSSAKHRTLDLTIAIKSKVEMGVNGVPYWNAKPLEIALGDTEIWRIVNNTDFSHPFHLHGYFFQVQDDARVPGVERHGQRADEIGADDCRAVRRAAGSVDVPLPHPRSRRGRHDGPPRRARSERAAIPYDARPAPPLSRASAGDVLGHLDEVAVGIAEVDGAQLAEGALSRHGPRLDRDLAGPRDGRARRRAARRRSSRNRPSRTSAAAPWSASPWCGPED